VYLKGRGAACALGVTEGALRYRWLRLAAGATDGRAGQPTALDGLEAAVAGVLAQLAPTAPAGRPVCGRLVYEALVAEHGYQGSYPALNRYLRRLRGVPPRRAVCRIETPPGVQAQHDWFEERVDLGGTVVRVFGLLGTLSHSRGSVVAPCRVWPRKKRGGGMSRMSGRRIRSSSGGMVSAKNQKSPFDGAPPVHGTGRTPPLTRLRQN
jgi:hypothetical protein